MITQSGQLSRQRPRARQQRAAHVARRDRAADRREARPARVHPRRRGGYSSGRRHGDGRRGPARLRQAQHRRPSRRRKREPSERPQLAARRPATRRRTKPCSRLSRAPPRLIGGCFAICVRIGWIVVAAVVPAAIYAVARHGRAAVDERVDRRAQGRRAQRGQRVADSVADRRAVSDPRRHGLLDGLRAWPGSAGP